MCLPHSFSILLDRPSLPHEVLFFNEEIVHIIPVSVIVIGFVGTHTSVLIMFKDVLDLYARRTNEMHTPLNNLFQIKLSST